MSMTRADVLARIRETDYRKLMKYSAVSAVAFPVTQVILLICTGPLDMSGVQANLIAVTLMSIPAYILNRYWVWGKKDKNRFTTEILPFWIVTLVGLALSTLFAHYADMWSDSPLAINLANALGFGTVWVFKFLILDKAMFGAHRHFPIEEDLEVELESAPAG
jgi:putative flippase GtrA